MVQVHLSCDYLVDVPIETDLHGQLGYVDPSDLGLSDALVQDLRAYQRRWEETTEDWTSDAGSGADAEGDAGDEALEGIDGMRSHLLDRLRTELGPGYVVRAT